MNAPPAISKIAEASRTIDEYRFLLKGHLDIETLERYGRLAERWGCAPHEVMIATGRIGETRYYRALAAHCGTDFIEGDTVGELRSPSPGASPRDCLRTGILRRIRNGKTGYVLTPRRARPSQVPTSLRKIFGSQNDISIMAPALLRESVMRNYASQLMENAKHGLTRRYPRESAVDRMPRGQRIGFVMLAMLMLLSGAIMPDETVRVLASLATLFVCLFVALRIATCIHLATAIATLWSRREIQHIADADLPVYTVFVPLFREHRVLPGLVRALTRIDYPAAKLDIKLILESVDTKTIAAARSLGLPGCFEVIVVPDAQPRTKPKALNYALQFARGDFAVIYDAEDMPEPDQLRKSVAAFHAGPPNLACLQARLNYFNGQENWLTRQFAIEYTALFDGYLPTFEQLGLPIPLGGTSNHFRMPALKWLGAWDAYNVTEDADLGLRLYRRGYVCQMLDSTTLEEAPCQFTAWLCQRTRWLKGYMQTWLVHMRRPLRLWRELGTSGFLGFQIIIGGAFISALIHPHFYLLVALDCATGSLLLAPGGLLGTQFWVLALFNAVFGYLASMAVGLLAVWRRGAPLTCQVLFMPLYWLLTSLAAYRALIQLVRNPFYWEKTAHGVSSISSPAAGKRD